jgi:hypothetical protein
MLSNPVKSATAGCWPPGYSPLSIAMASAPGICCRAELRSLDGDAMRPIKGKTCDSPK